MGFLLLPFIWVCMLLEWICKKLCLICQLPGETEPIQRKYNGKINPADQRTTEQQRKIAGEPDIKPPTGDSVPVKEKVIPRTPEPEIIFDFKTHDKKRNRKDNDRGGR